MAPTLRRSSRRKAAWIGFFLVAFTRLSSCSIEETTGQALLDDKFSDTIPETTRYVEDVRTETRPQKPFSDEYDQSIEAARAYRQALETLKVFNSVSPLYSHIHLDLQPNSLLTTLFPNQQGPVASAVRILYKLRHQSWIPRFISSGIGREGWMSEKKKEELQMCAVKVVDLLEHAVELGNMEALHKLAHISLFSPSPLLHNVTRAFESYFEHASLTGNGTSQAMLGFFYSTGYQNMVEMDQAKALLHYTFGALGGDKSAQMAMGYRYLAGIGVNDDCMQALEWYQAAAEHSMAKFLSGPPGGLTMPHTITRLSDLAGGVYGLGASVASTGLNTLRPVIRAAAAHQAGENWDDVLEYYVFNADRGDMDFAFRLGKIFYQGSIYSLPGGIAFGAEGVGAIQRDYGRAATYFLRIARDVWPRDNPSSPLARKEQGEDGPVGYASAAAGYLGRMYLRGEGVKHDFQMAKMWYERGAAYGDGESHNGLGIFYRDGLLDGKRDLQRAYKHFTVAAAQELAEAQVNLGKLHYERGEIKLATTYFEAAVRHGSPFEAYYYLAELHTANAQNVTTPSNIAAASCSMAVSFYKLVAERGAWSDRLVHDGEVRWRSGNQYAKEDALLRWWVAAELGYEAAQNNLAYALDQERSKNKLRITGFAPTVPSNDDSARLALIQWTRSAAQRNIDALVKVGDYYYYGLGVAEESEASRWEKAATYYQSAVHTQLSAIAMWNLGWMYENGVGVPQDYHLAKRHYDMALETNSEAYLPIVLSLIKLHARSLWHTLTGGKDGLSLWSADEKEINSPAPKELEPESSEVDPSEGLPEEEDNLDTLDDGGWYMGRAKEEHLRRRKSLEMKKMRNEEDPIQWAMDRRNAETDRDDDYGPDDYFEGTTLRGGRREGQRDRDAQAEEDEFVETMLLVTLCLMVSGLIWLRGRWVDRQRREEDNVRRAAGQAPRQNDGAFPPLVDPGRNEW